MLGMMIFISYLHLSDIVQSSRLCSDGSAQVSICFRFCAKSSMYSEAHQALPRAHRQARQGKAEVLPILCNGCFAFHAEATGKQEADKREFDTLLVDSTSARGNLSTASARRAQMNL